MKKIIPVINTDGSDSAQFDNCVELLTLAGRELPHAMMMMIPEPWENHESMDAERRAFYEFHSCLMEPWDGPASMAFTDGIRIGACLDRNGLRPSRYYVTKDDVVIMASEAGVLPVEPERIASRAVAAGQNVFGGPRTGPHHRGRGAEEKICLRAAISKWLDENHVLLKNLPEPPVLHEEDHMTVLQRQQAFGYTFEDLRFIVGPMARDGMQPLGSMGTDTPLAVLSNKPQLLYNYFKQLFAQVTNPPIDPIREEIITSTEIMVGGEGNMLEPTPQSSRLVKMHYPILTNEELEKLRHIQRPGFKSVTLPILFNVADGPKALASALEKVFAAADQAVVDGANIVVLSDRGVSACARADSRTAGGFRRASPSHPQRHANEDRSDSRIRRAARGASFRPAHRLRLQRHQSVSRLRDHRGFDARGNFWPRPTIRLASKNTSRPPSRASSRRWPRWASRHPELPRRADF
jgi:glutamate synthase (NADPH/NADH) large chain